MVMIKVRHQSVGRARRLRLGGALLAGLAVGCGAAGNAQAPAQDHSASTQTGGANQLSVQPDQAGTIQGQAKSLAVVNPAPPVQPEGSIAPAPGILVDQVIGIVNGDLILESDVNEERRFQAFQPYRSSASFSRVEAIRRLVDRQLILQQAKLNPDNQVTDAQAETQLQALRKDIPACRQYHCETEAGWNKFVTAQGFTQRELLNLWKQRMQILNFIEVRFRMGVQITPAQIKTYYDKTLLPQFASKGAPAPKLATISDRIQEILLQQQVSSLLGDWLKQLKAQGTVRMLRPDEVQP